MSQTEMQYVSDTDGKKVGVIVPIELWHEIASERETAYLLQSKTMKARQCGSVSLTSVLQCSLLVKQRRLVKLLQLLFSVRKSYAIPLQPGEHSEQLQYCSLN